MRVHKFGYKKKLISTDNCFIYYSHKYFCCTVKTDLLVCYNIYWFLKNQNQTWCHLDVKTTVWQQSAVSQRGFYAVALLTKGDGKPNSDIPV